MDKEEARSLLSARVEELRAAPYAALVERFLGESETVETPGRCGAAYQLQTRAFWDDRREGNLRVVVAIDDGGWRAFVPLTDGFIVAPDGSFVGE